MLKSKQVETHDHFYFYFYLIPKKGAATKRCSSFFIQTPNGVSAKPRAHHPAGAIVHAEERAGDTAGQPLPISILRDPGFWLR